MRERQFSHISYLKLYSTYKQWRMLRHPSIQHDEHAHRFKLTALIENVIEHNAVIHIDIGLMGKDVKTSVREQFKG